MLRLFLILTTIFLTSFAYAGITSFTQTLESICQDCSVSAWDFVSSGEKIAKYENPNGIQTSKEIVLLVPQGGIFDKGGNLATIESLSALDETDIGRKIIAKITTEQNGKIVSNVGVKLFIEVPIEFGRPNIYNPMWVTEKNSVHELYGAFDSNGEVGIIALNNYQQRFNIPYTFIHEAFHLLDANDRIGDPVIDNFLAEYRALLAEVVFHIEHVRFLNKEGQFYQVPKWHTQFVRTFFNKINTDRLFDKTLDLLYPENQSVVAIDKDSFHFLVDRIGFKGDGLLPATKIGFSNDSSLLQAKRSENLEIRKKIKAFFKNHDDLLDKKYLDNIRPTGLNTFDSIGGPRPRGPGG